MYTKGEPEGSVNFRPGSNPNQMRINRMIQADSVLSTPPTNTSSIQEANPALEARAESRGFAFCPNRHRAPDRGRAAGDPLKGIKGLSRRTALAGIAMLPAVLPAAMRAAASAEPDPIFAAIEVHRKAKAAAAAAFAEVERLTTIADAEVGPRSLPVLNMVQPGRFKEFVDVTSWIDIDQLVPAEIYPDENAHFRERLRRQQEDHDAIVGDTDEITDEPCAVL